jgi:hypothetical protein
MLFIQRALTKKFQIALIWPIIKADAGCFVCLSAWKSA